MSKYRTDILLLTLLLILALYAWRDIPQMVIRSDGFVYMVSATLKEFFSRKYWFTGFETSAAILGTILPKLFKTDIKLYFYTSLVYMMFINVIFYFMVRVITKNKLIAFFGALLFAANYFGNWDMYSQHCYCFFIERIVVTPFFLAAFAFLHLYLEQKKNNLYFISLALYFLGVGFAHFALFLTPLFVLYPFFWEIFNRKKNRKIAFKDILIGVPFFLISGFFVLIQKVSYAQIGPTTGMVQYLLDPSKNQYPSKIIRQFVHWTQYQSIILHFGESGLYRLLDRKSAEDATLGVVILYVIAALIIYKKSPKMRPLLFTALLGTIVMFFMNAWFGQYDIFFQAGSNRYLYFPTILLALFWMLFLWTLWKINRLTRVLVVLALTGYYLLNVLLINSTAIDVLSWDRSTKVTYNYMTDMRGRLAKNTLVVTPYPETGVYESNFFTQQIGNGEVEYLSERNPYKSWVEEASVSAHVIKLSYNGDCDCIKEEKIK